MTRFANVPTGWAAFRALRRPPTPLPHRRHGNWIHGRFSRSQIEGMREAGRLIRIVRGTWRLPDLVEVDRPAPMAWKAYRDARHQTRPKQKMIGGFAV